MILPKTRLKNQLALINAFSKILIITLAVFLIPRVVRTISINEMDNQLIKKLDQVYELIEDRGIEEFISADEMDMGFGSYNILKEEYISIEGTTDTVLSEYIDNSERIIEEELYDYRVISAVIQYDEDYYLIEIGKSVNSILSFETKLNRFAFYLLLGLLTLTIIFDLSVTQIILRPFDQLIQKLTASNHPTTFDYSSVNTSTTDFRYLEESIHSLMQRIEDAFQNEREFIGNISHEILTPISIIRSKLDNFVNTTELSDQELIRIIESKMTLGRLTKLVRTLLLMSRIENQEYLLNEKLNINSLLNEVVNEMSERFEIKDLNVYIDNSYSDIRIKGNQDLMHILFYNLITNSVKYTAEGGSIRISAQHLNDHAEISISDTGCGIASVDLPHIFSRFKKFKEGENNFGLGLSLVKRIADYHQIQIEVESEIDKGSCFKLIFK